MAETGTAKKLVVYYSWGNNTKAVAEYIAQKTGADILVLAVKEPYPADYNDCVGKVGRDGREYEPALSEEAPDLSPYGIIFTGSPCWWGTIANPLRTFLHQNDFSGKTIAPFMTHGTSGLHVQDIQKLCPSAKILKGLGIFNRYQVSAQENTTANMGDYKASIDLWLKTLEC